ncbi:MAG: hypothetical protein Q8K60_02385 [Parachlamydiaceae bacterium]|nr:hypothetical protein [Parachlamydiaceae bacterium]
MSDTNKVNDVLYQISNLNDEYLNNNKDRKILLNHVPYLSSGTRTERLKKMHDIFLDINVYFTMGERKTLTIDCDLLQTAIGKIESFKSKKQELNEIESTYLKVSKNLICNIPKIFMKNFSSKEKVRSLAKEEFPFNNIFIQWLSPQEISWLSSNQIKLLNQWQIFALNNNQIQALTLKQIQSLTNDQIQFLSKIQQQSLKKVQIQALSNHQLNHLPQWKLVVFTPEQISYMTPDQLKELDAKITGLTDAQLEKLTKDQIAALTVKQLQLLIPRIHLFTQEQIKGFTTDHIESITDKQLSLFKSWNLAIFLEKNVSCEKKEQILDAEKNCLKNWDINFIKVIKQRKIQYQP